MKKIYFGAGQTTDDNIIWRMRVACWVTKGYRHTLRIRNISYYCTATTVTRTHRDVTFIRTLSILFTFSAGSGVRLSNSIRFRKRVNIATPDLLRL